MDEIVINIANDFSPTPGPRYKEEGKFSAEEFLENILLEKYNKAIKEGNQITVILDGTAGYATSFLEGVFGELVRKRTRKEVKSIFKFISKEEPYLIDEINQYIDNA